MNSDIQAITNRIIERSTISRQAYLRQIKKETVSAIIARKAQHDKKFAALVDQPVARRVLIEKTCLAHAAGSCSTADKDLLYGNATPNLGIITAYNDMLTAHQPYGVYPDIIKNAVRSIGATAQVATGTPAQCDGVTQGEPGGMQSLPSRDAIASAVGFGLAHGTFDAAVYLGVCDKITPGMLMGALKFGGALPSLFIPSGPMTTGLSNERKVELRQMHQRGEIDEEQLLRMGEAKSYHGPGTCTFYGTANSNELFKEVMGLMIPDASFHNPDTDVRTQLTIEAAKQIVGRWEHSGDYMPIGEMVDERVLVNGIVGLLASGGSTNHTLHTIAIAASAGIQLTWDDWNDLSDVVPSIVKIYPNGSFDVNQFREAGGTGYVIRELLDAGLLHEDVNTVMGKGLRQYATRATLEDGKLKYVPAVDASSNASILHPVSDPYSPTGGIRTLEGNLGKAVVKVSSLKGDAVLEAPAKVFLTQEELKEFGKDFKKNVEWINSQGGMIAVVSFNGPKANGMPELHKLNEILATFQKAGCEVGLVTDGRLSGASSSVLAAIHVTPEAIDGGPLARVRDGDIVRIDAKNRTLDFVGDVAAFDAREPIDVDVAELHGADMPSIWNNIEDFRRLTNRADQGATKFPALTA